MARSQVALNQPIKSIGLHAVRIVLHPEVETSITINVARSDDEAERQARGEDLTRAGRDEVAPEASEARAEQAGARRLPRPSQPAMPLPRVPRPRRGKKSRPVEKVVWRPS